MRRSIMSFVFFGILVVPALAQISTEPQRGQQQSPNMAPRNETIPDRVRTRDPGGSEIMNVRSGLADQPQAADPKPAVRQKMRDDRRKPH